MPRFATTKDTQQFSKNFPDLKYNKLGNTNLTISPAGFGSYRVHISIDEHRKALKHAIQNGINLIDTSSNYADGGSEELIGSVVRELIGSNKIKREEIVIVNKAGYLQGQNYNISQQLKAKGNPYPDLIEYSQGLEHCIHPQFLEGQLTQSLKRLNLETIDVYLLHNPEYYLLWAHNNGIPLKEAQDEFYHRIEKAFMHLEIEAQNGKIQYYGISSNTFPVSSKMYGFIDLSRVLEIAHSISKEHKFKIIQFPLNLLEKGAITEINQVNGQSVLDFAKNNDLGVFTNRPLNAFVNNQLSRLLSIVTSKKSDEKKLDTKLKEISEMENEFIEKVLPTLQISEDDQKNLSGLFSSGTYLHDNYQKLGPYWQWIDSQARYLTDQLSYAVQLVNDAKGKTEEVIKWLDKYVESFNELLGNLTLYYGEISSNHNNQILNTIKADNPQLSNVTSLQQLALSMLFSTKGISSVLVGMRRTEYVEDILNILRTASSNKNAIRLWSNLKI